MQCGCFSFDVITSIGCLSWWRRMRDRIKSQVGIYSVGECYFTCLPHWYSRLWVQTARAKSCEEWRWRSSYSKTCVEAFSWYLWRSDALREVAYRKRVTWSISLESKECFSDRLGYNFHWLTRRDCSKHKIETRFGVDASIDVDL